MDIAFPTQIITIPDDFNNFPNQMNAFPYKIYVFPFEIHDEISILIIQINDFRNEIFQINLMTPNY